MATHSSPKWWLSVTRVMADKKANRHPMNTRFDPYSSCRRYPTEYRVAHKKRTLTKERKSNPRASSASHPEEVGEGSFSQQPATRRACANAVTSSTLSRCPFDRSAKVTPLASNGNRYRATSIVTLSTSSGGPCRCGQTPDGCGTPRFPSQTPLQTGPAGFPTRSARASPGRRPVRR